MNNIVKKKKQFMSFPPACRSTTRWAGRLVGSERLYGRID